MPAQTRKMKPPDEVADVVKSVGQFIEFWGFKRIHGEIWVHLHISSVPLDATTLVQRLKVSKALVSLAIKDLLKYQVIRANGKGPKRTIFYETNPEMFKVIANVLRERERKMLEKIQLAVAQLQGLDLSRHPCLAEAKIQSLGETVGAAKGFLDLMIHEELASAIGVRLP